MMILVYHRIAPKERCNELAGRGAIHPDEFERHMRLLARRIIPLRVALEDKAARDDKWISVTFDDGYLDNYEFALPILRRYGIHATIFLVTDKVESGDSFWWDELGALLMNAINKRFSFRTRPFSIEAPNSRLKTFQTFSSMIARDEQRARFILDELKGLLGSRREESGGLMLRWNHIAEMVSEGIEFGSHSHTHLRLSLVHDKEVLAREIRTPKEILEKRLGKSVDMFAFPYGRETDYSSAAVEEIKLAGYKYALTGVIDTFRSQMDVMEIPRLGILKTDTPYSILLKTTSWYAPAYRMVRRFLRKDKKPRWV